MFKFRRHFPHSPFHFNQYICHRTLLLRRFMILFSRVCLYFMQVCVCVSAPVSVCVVVCVHKYFHFYILSSRISCFYCFTDNNVCACCLLFDGNSVLIHLNWRLSQWQRTSERTIVKEAGQAKSSQAKPLCCAQTNNIVEISCRK